MLHLHTLMEEQKGKTCEKNDQDHGLVKFQVYVQTTYVYLNMYLPASLRSASSLDSTCIACSVKLIARVLGNQALICV